jgi:glycosyltransferase involved in cell wall biosynthesis
MRILLLAPHPYYQERGTPIAVDLLAATLIRQNHLVDILTYHEGTNRDHGPNLRIIRISAPPGCNRIRPGFSVKKLIADLVLYRRARQLVQENSYDIIHAVEESAFMARRIKQRYGLPYIFDMDSSMPVQMADGQPLFRPLLPLLKRVEAAAIRDATAVTAVCDALADIARQAGAHRIFLLRDVPLLHPDRSTNIGFRSTLPPANCRFVYIGNLEAYQGIDLLLTSFAQLPNPLNAQLIIVGGISHHIDHYRRKARSLGIDEQTHFLGPRPVNKLPALMADADVLVSPRTKGQNTPMKIYSYMASGKAILATDLPTHTQVLTPDSAQLAAPTPVDFAAAMETLAQNPKLRDQLGKAAAERVAREYSLAVFEQTVADLYASVQEGV